MFRPNLNKNKFKIIRYSCYGSTMDILNERNKEYYSSEVYNKNFKEIVESVREKRQRCADSRRSRRNNLNSDQLFLKEKQMRNSKTVLCHFR